MLVESKNLENLGLMLKSKIKTFASVLEACLLLLLLERAFCKAFHLMYFSDKNFFTCLKLANT